MGILTAARRPVQLVFAGKAHPADETGKHNIQKVYRRAIDSMFAGRIVFVDDYDLHVAHFLVQGCDVWLNNPRKPLEASGTSGMKASINGVPQPEHRRRLVGRRLFGQQRLADRRAARRRADPDAVDAADAESLYQLLEREVVPTFYDRDAQGIPRRWCAIVRQAILTVTPRFSARRMVKEYADSDVRAGHAAGCGPGTADNALGSTYVSQQGHDPDTVRPLRREGRLRASGRGAVLP